jgi:hypothetical protein
MLGAYLTFEKKKTNLLGFFFFLKLKTFPF